MSPRGRPSFAYNASYHISTSASFSSQFGTLNRRSHPHPPYHSMRISALPVLIHSVSHSLNRTCLSPSSHKPAPLSCLALPCPALTYCTLSPCQQSPCQSNTLQTWALQIRPLVELKYMTMGSRSPLLKNIYKEREREYIYKEKERERERVSGLCLG